MYNPVKNKEKEKTLTYCDTQIAADENENTHCTANYVFFYFMGKKITSGNCHISI